MGCTTLRMKNLLERQAQVANQSSTEKIMSWHFRLGHPIFSMYFYLFIFIGKAS